MYKRQVLALLIPNVQPWTDIITLLGSLFVGALKAVAPVLVFFLVTVSYTHLDVYKRQLLVRSS